MEKLREFVVLTFPAGSIAENDLKVIRDAIRAQGGTLVPVPYDVMKALGSAPRAEKFFFQP